MKNRANGDEVEDAVSLREAQEREAEERSDEISYELEMARAGSRASSPGHGGPRASDGAFLFWTVALCYAMSYLMVSVLDLRGVRGWPNVLKAALITLPIVVLSATFSAMPPHFREAIGEDGGRIVAGVGWACFLTLLLLSYLAVQP